jgi:carbohydrate-binding DOMON domain-containing protein
LRETAVNGPRAKRRRHEADDGWRPGWAFTVVLTGQDGFSPDQARGFTPTPGDFSFGVCAPGGNSPICAVDPGSVPKAVDVLTPDGVSQATELDPTAGPVTIAGVPVPGS